MTTLEDVIEQYQHIIEDKLSSVDAEKAKLDLLIEVQKIKNNRVNGEKLTADETQQVLNLLCWGDFAGCCAAIKNCPWREAVSDVLGVDYQELYGAKQQTTAVFLKNNMR